MPAMTAAFLAGLLAGYGIALPVGAMSVLIITLSARTSLRTGVLAGLGVATADAVYALVAVLGGITVARLVEPIAQPLRWVAAAVLAGVAIAGMVRTVRNPATQRAAPAPTRVYLGLIGLTLLNPVTVVYFGALVLGQHAEWSPPQAVVFVLGAGVASASWQLFLALGGAGLGRTLNTWRGRLWTALIGNGVVLGLALHLGFGN